MSTVTERVAAGATYLDEHDPDWWRADVPNAIDLRTLRMSNADQCILGQRCPVEVLDTWREIEGDNVIEPFHAQAQELHGTNNWSELWQWSIDCGFNWEGATTDQWNALGDEWARVIEARRAS